MTESCKTCRYWKSPNEKLGLCRRYPPKPYLDVSGDLNNICSVTEDFFVGTKHDDWCGEYCDRESYKEQEK